MNTVIVKNCKTLFIGRRGENEVTEVVFDFSEWQEQFGAGVIDLYVKRSVDFDAYPVVLSIDGTVATWLVTAADTDVVGSGKIEFEGKDITKTPPHKIVAMGMAHVPEGRHVFPDMTVLQNLMLGAFTRTDSAQVSATLEVVYKRFPRLKERAKQMAGTLSGGEQQMLAMGRAMMCHPKLLMLDEPSMGLSPILVDQIFSIIKDLHKSVGGGCLMRPVDLKLALHLCRLAETVLHCSDEPVARAIVQASDQLVDGDLSLAHLRVDRHRLAIEAVVLGLVRPAHVVGLSSLDDHRGGAANVCARDRDRHGHLCQRADRPAYSVHGDRLRCQ